MSVVNKKSKTKKGLIKGQSTSVLISIGVHAALLIGAATFVAVEIVKQKEVVFVQPEKVERPKMPKAKPRARTKDMKPQASTRIVSQGAANAPTLQVPDVVDASSSFGGGMDTFTLVPEVGEMSVFGATESVAVGNDFEGTFYSLMYDRRKERTHIDDSTYEAIIKEFVDRDWNPYIFTPYYRGPNKLYATQIFVPIISSEFGPSLFGVPYGLDFDPIYWCVHYTGKIMRKEGGRFRFWGFGDDVLLVRVNGELVLNASYETHRHRLTEWEKDPEDYKYWLGHAQAAVGHWFELEPGEPVEMEVLIGEIPGGQFCAYLLVEEEGETYFPNEQGMPILPVFKTAEIPEPVKDLIKYTLIEGEGDLDADLMFNVH